MLYFRLVAIINRQLPKDVTFPDIQVGQELPNVGSSLGKVLSLWTWTACYFSKYECMVCGISLIKT